MSKKEYKKHPTLIRQELQVVEAIPGIETFRVFPWGLLSGFEFVLQEDLPHMSGASRVEVQLHFDGMSIGGMRGFSLHRNVGLEG